MPDEVSSRVRRAIELSQKGERERARDLFAALWAELAEEGDALHRLSVAHWMADLQDDAHAELDWDLRALAAAGEITDERARQAGVSGSVTALFPSLHLNLGEDHRKLGDLAEARRHLQLGLSAAAALGDDGYSQMIKGGLDALADRLDAPGGGGCSGVDAGAQPIMPTPAGAAHKRTAAVDSGR